MSLNRDDVLELLRRVRDGHVTPVEGAAELGELSVAELGAEGQPFARVDHHRALRCGFPEVVYAPGKTPEQVAAVAVELLSRSPRLLVTRLSGDQIEVLRAAVPDVWIHARARAGVVDREPRPREGRVAVISAGTADEPVAEEARVTAEAMGVGAEALYDCGVAGIHRLLDVLPRLRHVQAVVVVAGMEGALASVVGGLVDVPVVAVPTSVGYGASFEGIGPLLTMLNSCAAGVGVVNIDNGFGGGYLAARIAHLASRPAAPAATPPGEPGDAPLHGEKDPA